MKRWLITGLAVLVVIAVGVGVFFLMLRPLPTLDEYTLTSFEDGQTITLPALRGKPVLLTSWSTNCTECKATFASLEQVWQDYKDHGLSVIPVNVDGAGKDAAIRAMLTETELTVPTWRDPDNTYARMFNAKKVPTTYLLDGNGLVALTLEGPVDFRRPDIIWAIEQLLDLAR